MWFQNETKFREHLVGCIKSLICCSLSPQYVRQLFKPNTCF